VLFFRLEEESPALLLHLPKALVKDCFFASAFNAGCRLVVETVQAPNCALKGVGETANKSKIQRYPWLEAHKMGLQCPFFAS
jgi:hypothetical protein